MKSIRVKNLRSILDSGEIDINKLNIFLGENSSGKSTILRLFPMLKETINHELRSPLLWFGDTYDYGSFEDAISKYADGQNITLEFQWDAISKKRESRCESCKYYNRKVLGFLLSDTYKLTVVIGKRNNQPVFQTVSISTGKHSITVETSEAGFLDFYIDNNKFQGGALKWRYGAKGLLPNLEPKNSKYETPLRKIQNDINKMIPNSFDGRLLNSDFESLFYVNSLNFDDIYNHITNEKNPFGRLIKQSLDKDSTDAKKFCDNIILANIFHCLEYADSYVSSTFLSSYYMMPLRYSIGRYLRNRDLAVDFIDSSGENVMDYISSLDSSELKSFNSFLKDAIQISVNVDRRSSGNKELIVETLSNGKKEKHNIVDVGYGITQVLPIATMLWDRARRFNDCEFYDIVVIEQPEVHLHPRMQENLAKLLVSSLELSKKNKGELRLIIETHSSVLVNRIGKFIRETTKDRDIPYKLSEKDTTIYLFEKKDGITSIQKTYYSTDGRIQKWPLGFLD